MRNNNYKTAEAKATREALAQFVVARDVLAKDIDTIGTKLRNTSACLKTDLEDLAKISRGETVGRTEVEVKASVEALSKKVEALKKDKEDAEAKFATATKPAFDLFAKAGEVYITKEGKWCSSETKYAHKVNGLFGAYQRAISEKDVFGYRRAVSQWLYDCGVLPSEAGVADLMNVGGTKINNGKAYIKGAIANNRQFDKAAYTVTEKGEHAFLEAFLNRVCGQATACEALPLRKMEYELTGKKTISTGKKSK